MPNKQFAFTVWPATSFISKLLLILVFASLVYGVLIISRLLPLAPHTTILLIVAFVTLFLAVVGFIRAYLAASKRIVSRRLPASITYLELELASRLALGLLLLNAICLYFLLSRSLGQLMEPENFAAIMVIVGLYCAIYWNALMCAFNIRHHLLDMKIVGALTAKSTQPEAF